MATASTAKPQLAYEGPHPDLFLSLPASQQAELLEIHALMLSMPGWITTVGNLKGGGSKSTTVVYLALMMGLTGEPVLVVDADAENRSCLLWMSGTDEWPTSVRVVSWAGSTHSPHDMVERIRETRSKYKYVLIDTTPHDSDYLRAALRVTDELIVPAKPTPLDVMQLPQTLKVASEVEHTRGEPIYSTVLFTQAKKHTTSLRGFVEDVRDEKGYPVFGYGESRSREAQGSKRTSPFAISSLEAYAQAAFTVPVDFGEYVFVLRQLVEGRLTSNGEDS